MTSARHSLILFGLLLWKNFILQIRRPFGTLFELITPVVAMLFLITLRFSGLFHLVDRCFLTFEPDHLTVPDTPPLNLTTYTIYYTPNTTKTAAIANRVYERLGLSRLVIQGVENETMLESILSSSQAAENTGCFVQGAGIVFENELDFTIRLRHEVIFDNTWFTSLAGPTMSPQGARVSPNFYLAEGFLHLQNAVGLALIEDVAQTNVPFKISVEQFPFPAYLRDVFLFGAGLFIPTVLMIAFIYSFGSFVKELVLERETRIHETMLMMGLKQWVLWITWYLKETIFLLIPVLIVCIVLKFGQIYPQSDFFILFIYFFIYSLSLTSFAFLISVWFDSSRLGLIVAFLAWFINYAPFFYIVFQFDSLTFGAQLGVCVLSNTCMGIGMELMSRLEQEEVGLQWSNIADAMPTVSQLSFAWTMGFLLIDTVVYMLIACYISEVKPGQYGRPKPFYFLFLPSYWTGKHQNAKDVTVTDNTSSDDLDPLAIEKVTGDLEVGISIKNLTKVYGQSFLSKLVSNQMKRHQVKAVSNLSLNMYKGQITALLGHNGAGKTTTMSILTGLYTPTGGSATINGFDVLTSMNQIRKSLGVCPQHNILFDRLTVTEHLNFFLRIKGVFGSKHVKSQVEAMLTDLQLNDKMNVQVSNLSGGQKRKLSVGIALIGGSEVVILDEPTSGMDPYARRATWDLLTKHKEGRTILFTTHFMDEADLLGERIAIMVEGKLRCCGSSLFLKTRYGVGYHLTLAKEASCVSSRVEQLVKSFVPGAELISDVGAELSFILPSSSTPMFPNLFDRMESDKVDLGIESFGVSVTTMEEVFAKVGEDESKLSKHSLHGTSPPVLTNQNAVRGETVSESLLDSPSETQTTTLDVLMDETSLPKTPVATEVETTFTSSLAKKNNDLIHFSSNKTNTEDYTFNVGAVLWFQQLRSMLLKRAIHTFRFPAAIVLQFLIPVGSILLAMFSVLSFTSSGNSDPKRVLTIDNSALPSSELTLFYAQFENSSGLDLSQLNAASFGVSSLHNFTANVTNLMNTVASNLPNQTQDCCSYNHQILDQFCATRTPSELRMQCTNTDWGYFNCAFDGCLQCCRATALTVLPTCTKPFSVILPVPETSLDLCPTPPKLSYSAASNTQPKGLIASQNFYVAEVLLDLAESIGARTFFQQYQAGFTLGVRDPPYTTCSCNETLDCENITPLTTSSFATSDTPHYSVNQLCAVAHSLCQYGGDCSQLDGLGSFCDDLGSSFAGKSLSCNDSNQTGYSVDGLSLDLLQYSTCGEIGRRPSQCSLSSSERPVASVYPDQAPEIAATVWYNNQPYHMPAAALNAFHNILLRNLTGNETLSMTVSNHPLPLSPVAQASSVSSDPSGFGIAVFVIFGYSVLLANFVVFLVKEKETKAKHLQFVSGVHATTFWLANFIWDSLIILVAISLSTVVIAAFQLNAFSVGEPLAAVVVLMVLTCFASLPFTYFSTFLFSDNLIAFAILIVYYFFVPTCFLITIYVVQLIEDTTTNVDLLHNIFLVVPTYALGAGFSDLYNNQLVKEFCTQAQVEAINQLVCDGNSAIRFVDSPFVLERPGVAASFIYLIAEGVIFTLLTLLMEKKFFYSDIRGWLCSFRSSSLEYYLVGPDEDDDIAAEEEKVLSGSTDSNDVVVIKQLVKVYRNFINCRSKSAVNGISLAIPHGECFGLLGVNGAGKTTTFKILTGDLSATSGTAAIAGYDIKTNLREARQRIGYCPQFDALIELLTGRELLTMFARLRGVPEKQIKEVVEIEIARLDLKKHANKKCGTYSGGNKRKLSTAIALVGNPPIVLLDEPTTGMDPTTRRYLWNVLTDVVQEGRSIVLTSHSMEECEALCTRLAIMVNGSFKCLGGIQHLKNKFGSGLLLQAKVKLSPPTGETDPVPPKRKTLLRRISTQLFRRQSTRRNNEEELDEQPPSQTTNQISPPLHRQLTRRLTRMFSRTSDIAEPPPKPNYQAAPLHVFVQERFPGAAKLEEHEGAVTYKLPSDVASWSAVFKELESNKSKLGIEDYSISQTTLEQVFLQFAKVQKFDE